MSNTVYSVVTDRIVSLLERGVVPWRKPWNGIESAPKNLVSMRDYRGVNTFLLSASGYESPYWLTYRQAKERGGFVRKGEQSTPVVFWKTDRITESDPKSGEDKDRTRFLLRFYRVFNVSQCDGIDYPKPENRITFEPIERCESVVSAMPLCPAIQHDEPRAYYRPLTDTVNMPRRELFDSVEEFYSTLFHELTHATGHSSRLNRDGITSHNPFGSTDYSKEELVAEMGAAFLCGHCAIEQSTIENSAAYIAGWLKKLRNDSKLVVHAAAQAQKASDFILNVKHG